MLYCILIEIKYNYTPICTESDGYVLNQYLYWIVVWFIVCRCTEFKHVCLFVLLLRPCLGS